MGEIMGRGVKDLREETHGKYQKHLLKSNPRRRARVGVI